MDEHARGTVAASMVGVLLAGTLGMGEVGLLLVSAKSPQNHHAMNG